ncbi:ribonuclease T2 [Paralimibaculum aggregatum]|uniref:Ribonuclease T2 n=1 Tax=Paralimibaculum aggregatum TaxID=3036245 RepID=A0ABQ6LSD7_9RHOB|nr:ribonuclease T2 [Limibaculum sp. NKW23]GMG84989.1 ribonuclease T2 [Limibaculum sp. NKW23]
MQIKQYSAGAGWRRLGGVLALGIGLAIGFGAGLPGQRARAEGFDYYVLALSWNASWCRAEGDRRNAPQCDPRHDHGFLLHGLWPQGEDDWPEFCRSRGRDPSKRETRAMADIFGSGGLAWYQWKKHGRCSGMSSRDYFRLAREAYARVRRPEILRRIDTDMRLDPDVVEAAFLEENPGLDPDAIFVTCGDGLIREVRICLTRSLEPRACSHSARRDCRRSQALLPPMR